MLSKLSEVQVVPVKPINGLVGFASIVFDNSFYLGGIGIYTRPAGGYRITYPTKKQGNKGLNIFHPINKSIAKNIEQAVTSKFEALNK